MVPLQLAMWPRRLGDAARRARDNGHAEFKLLMQLPWGNFHGEVLVKLDVMLEGT